MYKVLWESIILILLLFKFLFKSASPWTRKFFGQQRWNASMPFITRYTRPNIRRDKNLGQRIWAPSNPWMNKYSICPTHGWTNIQYVQPMDDEMHTYSTCQKYSSRTWTGKWIYHQNNPTCGRGKGENYKFKDVMKNYYPVMLLRRRIKTGVLIKITPMDEQELIF